MLDFNNLLLGRAIISPSKRESLDSAKRKVCHYTRSGHNNCLETRHVIGGGNCSPAEIRRCGCGNETRAWKVTDFAAARWTSAFNRQIGHGWRPFFLRMLVSTSTTRRGFRCLPGPVWRGAHRQRDLRGPKRFSRCSSTIPVQHHPQPRHDRRGLCASGLLSDVEVVDDYPSHMTAFSRRSIAGARRLADNILAATAGA